MKRDYYPNKLGVYFPYVNNTFGLFNETEVDLFFTFLNKMHPALRFTLDKEMDHKHFLDVLVGRTPSHYVITIYQKPTFTSLYTRKDSFGLTKQKINLIKTLTHRALMICSESTLDAEIKFISTTLCNNSFPLNVVQTIITNKITEFNKIKQAPVQKCPGYLGLPWLGGISQRFAK